MTDTHPGKAIGAGFVATLVMTVLMYMAPMMGMPEMDIAGMLGNFLGIGWTMGMIVHFINGTIIFPLVYAYLIYRILPGSATARGVGWGLILFLLAQIVVMPMMGGGVFSSATPAPMMMVMGSLLGHLLYGAVLGKLAGSQYESVPSLQARHSA